MNQKLRIIVSGLIAQHRLLGGVAWGVLDWLIGLTRLGHDVYYIEDSGEWPYNLDGGPLGNDWIAYDCTPNVDHLNRIMSRFGLSDKWAYRFPIQPQWYGLSDSKRRELLRSADLLINKSGVIEHPELYREIPRLIYIDTDPVFTQIEILQGETDLKRRVDVHDLHFTYGECLPQSLSATGHNWLPLRQPIPLAEWRTSAQPRDAFTTVMNWTSYKPLSYAGENYGQKDLEFKRFLELPGMVPASVLEVALPRLQHKRWQSTYTDLPASVIRLLQENPDLKPPELLSKCGWRVIDAIEVGSDLDSYRQYIQSSKAEWSIAKNGYVKGYAGWFSNRSAIYLAAGRPVVVQDTGFEPVLPVGRGILTFRTIEEAAAAINDVEGNYSKHAQAAREIAEEFFDSDKVLNRLIERVFSSDTTVATADSHA